MRKIRILDSYLSPLDLLVAVMEAVAMLAAIVMGAFSIILIGEVLR